MDVPVPEDQVGRRYRPQRQGAPAHRANKIAAFHCFTTSPPFRIKRPVSSPCDILQINSFSDHFAHYAQKIATHDLLDILLAVAALQQGGRDCWHPGYVLEPYRYFFDAVPIAADADVIDAGHLHGMVNMRDCVFECRLTMMV